MPRLPALLAAWTVALGLLAACATRTGPRTGEPVLAGTSWALVRIEAGGAAREPEAGRAFTLGFEDGARLGGRADCNVYGGDYRTEGDGRLRVGPLTSTLAACAPSGVDDYPGVLEGVGTFRRDGDTLRVEAASGVRLLFARAAG